MPDLTILDVGHGNCAVLCDADGCVIIDAGYGDTLLRFLEHRAITQIDAILISHADADHTAGLLTLLTQPHLTIGAVFLNPDALRGTKAWEALLSALGDAWRRGKLILHTELTTTSTAQLQRNEVELEVLAPAPELALVGAGGRHPAAGKLTANSMSAVVRVVVNGRPEALLTGDLDATGLDLLLADYPSPQARVLVFPHHGGLPGGADPAAFASRLCAAVCADLVIFSIGRGKHGTPHPDVISGVMQANSRGHIACTQLSQRCAASIPPHSSRHLGSSPARGRSVNTCCAGSLELNLGAPILTCSPTSKAHSIFIDSSAPTALCKRGILRKSGS